MTAWSISPDGVRTVLTNVQSSSVELGTAFQGIEGAQGELVGGVGEILSASAAAAADLINSEQSRFESIAARIQACGLGAGQATAAYIAGDEEMAARTQAAAVTAAGSGDLSFFGGGR